MRDRAQGVMIGQPDEKYTLRSSTSRGRVPSRRALQRGPRLRCDVADQTRFSKHEVVAALRRAGLPLVADEARRSLPDEVDGEQVAEFGLRHGITRDWLVSQMGGSP